MNHHLSPDYSIDEKSRLLSSGIRIGSLVHVVFFLFAMIMAIAMSYRSLQAPLDLVGLLIAITLLVLTAMPIVLNILYLFGK